ncbi:hypothetical protein SGLAM104S_01682 [Streptomyces glaucescens]
MSETKSPLPREVADAFVDELIALDPVTGTYLGVKETSSRLPDTSPAGQEALAELARRTLARLDEAERRPGADSDIERRCARLLRERLTAELAVHEADEGLRAVGNMSTAAHHVREVFTVTPADTDEDWAAIAERLRAVPAALAGYRESLALGLDRKLYAGPRPTAVFLEQLTEWADTDGSGRGWFEDFAAAGPRPCGPGWTRRPGRRRPPWRSCGTGSARCTRRPSRAPRTRWAVTATPAGRATTTAPTSTWTRRTPTAGRSSTACSARCARRRRGSCPAPRRRGWRSHTSTSTAATSRASTRPGSGSRT